MKLLENVQIISRPGYFGKDRPRITSELNKNHPHWEECWQVNDHILNFNEAVLLYDDAYYHHLKNDLNLLEWVSHFGECYDSNKSNISCGVSHDNISSPRHIQDVSVRRALVRLGIYFKQYCGNNHYFYNENQLLHIRGSDTNGFCLMPGNVNFHLPDLILSEKIDNMPSWVKKGSVEDFWQSNKVIITQGS